MPQRYRILRAAPPEPPASRDAPLPDSAWSPTGEVYAETDDKPLADYIAEIEARDGWRYRGEAV